VFASVGIPAQTERQATRNSERGKEPDAEQNSLRAERIGANRTRVARIAAGGLAVVALILVALALRARLADDPTATQTAGLAASTNPTVATPTGKPEAAETAPFHASEPAVDALPVAVASTESAERTPVPTAQQPSAVPTERRTSARLPSVESEPAPTPSAPSLREPVVDPFANAYGGRK
jgi:uncharacterized membrane protein